jgi:Uma2 family endonuclease
MKPDPLKRMTLEEYLDFDKTSEGRFEYFDGEVFEMSGVSITHSDLEANLIALLMQKLAPRGCKVNPSNARIRVPKLPTYRYADVSVLCGDRIVEKMAGVEVLVNPTLIVEILSPATENYDRGEKFAEYKSIESFREYLLVSQEKKFVTLFTKHNDKFWFQSEYREGEELRLESLDCTLKIDEIYQGIDVAEARTQ